MAFIEEEDDWTQVLWPVPWYAHFPGAFLLIGMSAAWLLHQPGGMAAWGISGAALAGGRYDTIALHMAAHGPLAHLVMNMWVLVAISGPLVARLGRHPLAWARYLALFTLGGLAGTALFLVFHPQGSVPMLGASGAIYALFGLQLRLPLEPGPLLSVRTPEMRRVVIALVKENIFLFLLLALAALSTGGQAGLAWEAHLGGFLFGLFAGPRFLPEADEAEGASVAPPRKPRRSRTDPLSLVLRHAVGDLVIVALLADEDVHLETAAGGVEGTHGDRGPLLVRRIPEQHRAAGAQKPRRIFSEDWNQATLSRPCTISFSRGTFVDAQ